MVSEPRVSGDMAGEPGGAGLTPDGQWPVWLAPTGKDTHADGYGGISRYVTPHVIERRYFRSGHRDGLSRTGLRGVALDRATIGALWRELAAVGLSYAPPPWHPAQGQRIRDPGWLLRRDDQGAGTCVDLCLLFAGMCLNERLDTFLVLLRGDETGHVLVAVNLGADAPQDARELDARRREPMVPWGAQHVSPGLVRVLDVREFLRDDDDLLLLDVTVATRPAADRTLEASQAQAREVLDRGRHRLVHLVDVAFRQRACGDVPLPEPLRRGALRGRIERPSGITHRYPAHDKARAAVRGGAEKVAVTGRQGVGKSTLAREVAAAVDAGFGWFLPAASKEAFELALAEAELGERGEEIRDLEAAERQGLARSALARLGGTRDSWVIVLDNANAGAGPFDAAPAPIDRLPVPGQGQLIIATSTAPAAGWPGWRAVALPTVPAAEMAGQLGDAQVAALSAGRPLLMTAYKRLLAVAPGARAELPAAAESAGEDMASAEETDEAARRAAALYWATARRHLARAAGAPGGRADTLAYAERLGWLPPDRVEPGAAGEDEPDRAMLADIGLLGESARPGAYAVHRLFGEAIRSAVTADGRADAVVTGLLALSPARTSLLRHGDADVATALAAALADTSSGLALWALATLQEVHQSRLSSRTFERAEPLLDPADPEQATALADCLHAYGRVINQKEAATPKEIADAIEGMHRAITLRAASDTIGIAKHEALLALLRQRRARSIKDPAAKVAEFREVLDILEESWLKRRAILGDGDPLVDRAYFNRAGIRISLAKEIAADDPAAAAEYMTEVKEIYRRTEEFRKRYYTGPNPLTAASVAGIATLGYESVRHGITPQDAIDAVLGEAIDKATEALAMRKATSIPGDVRKSASILARLSVLQFRQAGGAPAALAATTVRELGILPETLEQLRVTADLLHRLGLET